MAVIQLRYPVPTIESGCRLFNVSPVKRGWLTLAGAKLFDKVVLWFPQFKNDYWNNSSSSAGSFDKIFESPKDPTKNSKQVSKYKGSGEIRVTFVKDKTTFHDSCYHFIGIYSLNESLTDSAGICVWERKCKECDTDSERLKEIVKTIK